MNFDSIDLAYTFWSFDCEGELRGNIEKPSIGIDGKCKKGRAFEWGSGRRHLHFWKINIGVYCELWWIVCNFEICFGAMMVLWKMEVHYTIHLLLMRCICISYMFWLILVKNLHLINEHKVKNHQNEFYSCVFLALSSRTKNIRNQTCKLIKYNFKINV